MRLNLGAVLHVTHAYLGAMVDSGWGRVVTIVSDAGRKGERYQAIYGSAKAGAMGFIARHRGRGRRARRDRELRGARHDEDRARPRTRSSSDPDLEAKLSQALHDPAPRPPRRSSRRSSRCSAATPGSWITGQVYPVDGGYASAPVAGPGPPWRGGR